MLLRSSTKLEIFEKKKENKCSNFVIYMFFVDRNKVNSYSTPNGPYATRDKDPPTSLIRARKAG